MVTGVPSRRKPSLNKYNNSNIINITNFPLKLFTKLAFKIFKNSIFSNDKGEVNFCSHSLRPENTNERKFDEQMA